VIVTLLRVFIYPNGIACAYHPYAVSGWSWGGPLVFAEQAIRMERVL
jgi:thioesterase domain-containing protein